MRFATFSLPIMLSSTALFAQEPTGLRMLGDLVGSWQAS